MLAARQSSPSAVTNGQLWHLMKIQLPDLLRALTHAGDSLVGKCFPSAASPEYENVKFGDVFEVLGVPSLMGLSEASVFCGEIHHNPVTCAPVNTARHCPVLGRGFSPQHDLIFPGTGSPRDRPLYSCLSSSWIQVSFCPVSNLPFYQNFPAAAVGAIWDQPLCGSVLLKRVNSENWRFLEN